ncbi:hypothetical protein RclHR1_00430022 [Rhizophagus clarus]|uniref:Uncharacterized protein n=1 Tax=Rhizophagus clarus TaxID=94130 RepID=A0A2Z6RTU3_9GLOM|nr:hypothetical protein RclHR1_00430022 [Rhizophagus clarus]
MAQYYILLKLQQLHNRYHLQKSSLFKLKRRTIDKENKLEEKESKKKPVKKITKEKTIQEEINDAYQAWCIASDKDTEFQCTAIQNDEPLQGKLLIEPITKLSNKPPLLWNEDDVMPIVKLLSGRTAIDGTGDNSDAYCSVLTVISYCAFQVINFLT